MRQNRVTAGACSHAVARALWLLVMLFCATTSHAVPPSAGSTVGQVVDNPKTGLPTTVSSLGLDPVTNAVTWVLTADQHAFLVRNPTETFWSHDTPPRELLVISVNALTGVTSVQEVGTLTAESLDGWMTKTQYDAEVLGLDLPPDPPTPNTNTSTPTGIEMVLHGANGAKGANQTASHRARGGKDGGPGPDLTVTNTQIVNALGVSAAIFGSVGGNGGRGGTPYPSFTAPDGGDGGRGGNVVVTNNADLTATQLAGVTDPIYGLFAFSRSGKAGDGANATFATGGKGGAAADGGDVTVVNNNRITTSAPDGFATGIYALSVSSRAGNGGSAFGFVGNSGNGNVGGNGGVVSVTHNAGAVITTGNLLVPSDYSPGIMAQSIGGSGGNGGRSSAIILALSGDGQDGGDGGRVTVNNHGDILTFGTYSHGIIAQSLGGGGGSSKDGGGFLAVGGSGADGGDGGQVDLLNSVTGRIFTRGSGADGILAQSIGGSGGAGGDGNGLIQSLGGSGDAGGNGAAVTVQNLGLIQTLGLGARGIVAQSIGGGGGDGGNAGATVRSVGGSGAGGGDGGLVSITQGGTILTSGAEARGILAQSIGGGGGSGGMSISEAFFNGMTVGGNGGGGGVGGQVAVTLQGTASGAASVLNTSGANAAGLVAQSIGGGGGNGGGSVSVTQGFALGSSYSVGGKGGSGGAGGVVGLKGGSGFSSVQTGGADSPGVILQSVGGGGGNGGFSVATQAGFSPTYNGSAATSIGGSGGSGGAGGLVGIGTFVADNLSTDILQGSVVTTGERSTGLLAQSVGGGGGNGGYSVAGAGGAATILNGSVAVAIGGSGGNGGAGGDLLLGLEMDVTTAGDHSSALVAQSIGGGGGNGGGSIAASISAAFSLSGSFSFGLGGSGGGGQGGGRVRLVTQGGTITTLGQNSTGILGQSVGGGGGNGGYSVTAGFSGAAAGAAAVNVAVGGSGGNGGNGGEVNVDLASAVETSGLNSAGVVLQSIGGGGGNGGYSIASGAALAGGGAGAMSLSLGGTGGAGGLGGLVDAFSAGDIHTRGANSAGFIAQSIGGGGGNGGYSVSASGAASFVGSGAVSVTLGGSGGAGNHGGLVKAILDGSVTTEGENSTAVLAQSIGGGGGNGGYSLSVAGAVSSGFAGAVGAVVGGDGAGGGNGAKVELEVRKAILTTGDRSGGVVAQSVGGGGGNGGMSINALASASGGASGTVGASVGGRGAGGGDGGEVVVEVRKALPVTQATIETRGDDSTGLLAQSVGGGGGNGGMAITGGVAASSGTAAGIGVSIGGSGGAGGTAGDVTATSRGSILTGGERSSGFIAQSLGGGGGNGGMAVTGIVSLSSSLSGAVSVGVGGSGGNGGAAGQVTANLLEDALIKTTGADSLGFVAQSIGGGGGNGGIGIGGSVSLSQGGSGAIGIGVGGNGGGGGAAGDVVAALTGSVQTSGMNSTGVLAQSIGGGGGSGGLSVAGALSAAGAGGGALAFGFGGAGGNGGNGNHVDLSLFGDVSTGGANAAALVAQSIGGGGGSGGMNVSGAVNLSQSLGGALAVGVGGSGGSGGSAGDVDVLLQKAVLGSARSTLTTSLGAAPGVVAQSIGGGGGHGGINLASSLNLTGSPGAAATVGIGGMGGGGGDAGLVKVKALADITTTGGASHGLLAQSIGGGGGNGGLNVSSSIQGTLAGSAGTPSGVLTLGVGGFGGSGGEGRAVNVEFDGGISAGNSTNAAHGLVAQSIGGGGGTGAVNVSSGIVLTQGFVNGYGMVAGVGGYGGAGGDAAKVDVTVTGGKTLLANGAGHSALLAQSIGGGGGAGGLNVNSSISSSASILVGVGGEGGNAGSAGKVTVNATANVEALSPATSSAIGAAGILAQSIGGGGGSGGMNVASSIILKKTPGLPAVNLGIGGMGGAGSAASGVEVHQTGNVNTTGAVVHGILAQSIGGGGGSGGMNLSNTISGSPDGAGGFSDVNVSVGVGGNGGAGGHAGDVLVTQSGTITTDGAGSRGIIAESIGGGGGYGGASFTGLFTWRSSPVTIGVGGNGGAAGDAGLVTVTRGSSGTAAGKISTKGTEARGIQATSIGGGGGDAGANINIAYSLIGVNNTAPGFGISVAIGGSGGAAGLGRDVQVDNFSEISTSGDGATGILAQSISGGGGNAGINFAGNNVSGKVGLTTNENLFFALAVGGSAADGSNGGRVEVNQTGNLSTAGVNAVGILAQSIGGGGGNTMLNTAFVNAGDGGLSMAIGRQGGTGGAGGEVSLTYRGELTTNGERSHGLQAQSIGNGGGNSGAITVGVTAPASLDLTGSQRAVSGGVSVGLQGATGGTGGTVTLLTLASSKVTTKKGGSHALFAQSVGGGGGNGGWASNAAFTEPAFALSVGGTGGIGGTGGLVNISNLATLLTEGESSHGIYAQSIGGGGGTGGTAMDGALMNYESSVNVTVGGRGGSGSAGGVVQVINDGDITTKGEKSNAITAQSIGGGGGDGGYALKGTVTRMAGVGASERFHLSTTVGGFGGTGGTGGLVSVTNAQTLTTSGLESRGIFAQSIGGGGGNGGSSATLQSTGERDSNFALSIGGQGGSGGTGGAVNVNNGVRGFDLNAAATISTTGERAHGIFAQSIGGGGGNGGWAVAANVPTGSFGTHSAYYGLSVGGIGGDGGTGGNVTVYNSASSLIETSGAGAHGIFAQSIGGGGGNGNFAATGDLSFSTSTPGKKNLAFAVGGTGGDGGKGGAVNVTNNGTIIARGAGSYGIFAQSIGGGGGDGHMAVAMSINSLSHLATSPLHPANAAAVLTTGAIGGFGGRGGDGGDVTVTNAGSIIVQDDTVFGILAQSIGGGGGNGGRSYSASVWSAADFGLHTIIGAVDYTGKTGKVTINDTSGSITTLGKDSSAIIDQSIGGGGGTFHDEFDFSQQLADRDSNGGLIPGGFIDTTTGNIRISYRLGGETNTEAPGNDILATHTGDLVTLGDGSLGSLIQSIGGGGGFGTSTLRYLEGSTALLSTILGALNVGDGSSGTVTLTETGSILTLGDESTGQLIQTIGGGGGVHILRLVEVPAASPPPPLAPLFLPPPPPPPPNAIGTLGADGGLPNHGGNQNLTLSGLAISTSGARSVGFLSQSIGGGGGTLFSTGASGLDLDLGGKNGASGNGGDLIVTHNRAVGTSGELSHGIVMQSIGGGGGLVLTDLPNSLINLTFNTSNTGNGGLINLTQTGDVVVTGARTTAIVLQSLGGGGGAVDDLFFGPSGGSGAGGAITLLLDGSVLASAAGGTGIFAQSAGTAGAGNITLTLASGRIITFGTGGTGVSISGGAANSFTNNGAVFGDDGITALTILGTDGSDSVLNNGLIIGRVDLGSGSNAFNNAFGALFDAGSLVNLGSAANLLTNNGDLSPGGVGLVLTTQLSGSLVQNGTGRLLAEIDFASAPGGQTDRIVLNGTAQLAGNLTISHLNGQVIMPGTFRRVIVDAAGGVTNNGMNLTTPPSQVITYSSDFAVSNGNEAAIIYDVNFAPSSGLDRNLTEVGQYLNRVQAAGSFSALSSTILALINEPTLEGYKQLLAQMSPEFYAEQQAEFIRGSQRFGESMLAGGFWREAIDKQRRWWVDISNSDTTHNEHGDYKAARMNSLAVTSGFDYDFAPHWTAGFAFGMEDNTASGYNGLWRAAGTTQRLGASLRHQSDRTLFALLVAYGWNQMETERSGTLATSYTAQSERHLEALTTMARVSHQFGDEAWYLRPAFDFGFTVMRALPATEHGATGGTNLALRYTTETHTWIRPSLEIGHVFSLSHGMRMRLFASASHQRFLDGTETNAVAGFEGAPDVAPMSVPTRVGALTHFTIGTSLLFDRTSVLGVLYTKSIGNEYDVDTVSARFSYGW